MLLGSLAAIGQTNIKRLMAYSSIGHMGYALIGLAAGTPTGMRGVLIYLVTYVFMNAGTFACIIAMRRRGRAVEQISDLSGLATNDPMLALAMTVFMFSMAGIPPFSGFCGKFFIFTPPCRAGMWALAVIGVLTSVIGAYYYLRIIKVMYFDTAEAAFDPRPASSPSWRGRSACSRRCSSCSRRRWWRRPKRRPRCCSGDAGVAARLAVGEGIRAVAVHLGPLSDSRQPAEPRGSRSWRGSRPRPRQPGPGLDLAAGQPESVRSAPAARVGSASWRWALLAAVALGRGLAPVAESALKWPNDLLLDGAKLAGILIDSAATGEAGSRAGDRLRRQSRRGTGC